jgi:hypothetical protein
MFCKKRILAEVFLFAFAAYLSADPLYTVTVRGLRKDLPFLAWQMTYRVTAATQKDAELQAMSNARRDGCEETSAYIVETTVTLTPDDTRPATPVIVVLPPQNTQQPEPPQESSPAIEYEEAYKAGYDHGVTGFLTNRGNFILNAEIPDKYREAEQGQAYKNGYARGFANEKLKAEKNKRKQSPPKPSRTDSAGATRRVDHYR